MASTCSSPTATPAAVKSARAAGLYYVTDQGPGITRRRTGSSFAFFDPKGKRLHEHNEIIRIKRLAIPPAWTDVWICPRQDGHLQATGRDVRGRKQYRYHTEWRTVRDETKYDRMADFGRVLPKIRQRVARDLAREGLPKEKVLATVVRLLETTLIRVGNDEYVRENESYGLTTMRNRHVSIHGAKVTFRFKGKSGKHHVIDIENRRLAQIVRRCRDLPGYDLFEYAASDGTPVNITSSDVNTYLHEITGQDFTAKDFRTWAGTVLAARALQEIQDFTSQREARHRMLQAIEAVAQLLGNTPSICRRSYIHPLVLDTYLDGSLARRLTKRAEQKLAKEITRLRPDEASIMVLLHQNLKRP